MKGHKIMSKTKQVVQYFNANEILTGFDNYRTVKKENQVANLEVSILEKGVLEPIHVDCNMNVFTGFSRTDICEKHDMKVPTIVHTDIDLSDMGKTEITALQNTYNIRINVPASDTLKAVKLAKEENYLPLEIAFMFGISPKQVYQYLRIDATQEGVKEMIDNKNSSNQIETYDKAIKSFPTLKKNKDFLSVCKNLTGEDLKKTAKTFTDKEKLRDLTKQTKEVGEFSPMPCPNSRNLEIRQDETLNIVSNITERLESFPETTRDVLKNLCNNVLFFYELDSESVTIKKLDFTAKVSKIHTQRDTIIKRDDNVKIKAQIAEVKERQKKELEAIKTGKSDS